MLPKNRRMIRRCVHTLGTSVFSLKARASTLFLKTTLPNLRALMRSPIQMSAEIEKSGHWPFIPRHSLDRPSLRRTVLTSRSLRLCVRLRCYVRYQAPLFHHPDLNSSIPYPRRKFSPQPKRPPSLGHTAPFPP